MEPSGIGVAYCEPPIGYSIQGVAARRTEKYNAEISQGGNVSELAVSAAQQICC